MAHETSMGDDGILRIAFTGDVSKRDLEAFLNDFTPFLEAATEARPVLTLVNSSQTGKYSLAARRIYLELNQDPRVGKAAVIGASRYARVLASFVLKATRRDNIRFFDSEKKAIAWLKAGR